jgi:SAM-dependent methyltransferase
MRERERWEKRHRAAADAPVGAPSAWVMERALALGARGVALDLASGRGRHALPLAASGWRVIAVDIAESAVAACRGSGARVDGVVADAGALPVRAGAIDLIVCVSFLDRAVIGHLSRLLRPGGALVCEIFTEAQRSLGRGPRSAAHLLRAGELPRLVRPLCVTEYDEGLARDVSGERYVARIVAVNCQGGGGGG